MIFENSRPFSWEVETGLDLGFENFLGFFRKIEIIMVTMIS
jgi:hypothetical protein